MNSKLSLQSIYEEVEAGRLRGHHIAAQIPPTDPEPSGSPQESSATASKKPTPISSRQRLLDLALIRGTINDPNICAAFTSPEFLDGMTTLNTTINTRDDSYSLEEFVEKLAASLSTISRIDNTEVTIGSRFRELRLWANGADLSPITRIVSSCPNLRKLELMICQYIHTLARQPRPGQVDMTRLLARYVIDKCRQFARNPVVSNLEELSINGQQAAPSFIECFLEAVRFANLRSLRIRGAEIESDIWRRFISSVDSTLISLEVEDFKLTGEWDQLIPFVMERLQRLRLTWLYKCRVALSKLYLWPELTSIRMAVLADFAPEEARAEIKGLKVDLAVDVRLEMRGFSDRVLLVQNQPRFRTVDVYGERITTFTLLCDNATWDERYDAALADVFVSCPKLIGIGLSSQSSRKGSPSAVIDLGRLIGRNLSGLTYIDLFGNIKVGKLLERCVDLEALAFCHEPHIRDEDLINWMRVGGGRRLTRLEIGGGYPHLGYNGIEALLIASGSTLEKFCFRGKEDEVEPLKRAVVKYCPFAAFEFRAFCCSSHD